MDSPIPLEPQGLLADSPVEPGRPAQPDRLMSVAILVILTRLNPLLHYPAPIVGHATHERLSVGTPK